MRKPVSCDALLKEMPHTNEEVTGNELPVHHHQMVQNSNPAISFFLKGPSGIEDVGHLEPDLSKSSQDIPK